GNAVRGIRRQRPEIAQRQRDDERLVGLAPRLPAGGAGDERRGEDRREREGQQQCRTKRGHDQSVRLKVAVSSPAAVATWTFTTHQPGMLNFMPSTSKR